MDRRARHREPVFYFIDSRRVTLREWSWGSPASVPFAVLSKLLRVPMRGPTDDPNVESLLPFERAVDDVPADVAQRFVPALRELAQLGFHSPIWHVIRDDLQLIGTYLATLQDNDGSVWARVHLRMSTGDASRTKLYCELVSELRGGAFLWSLSSRPDLEAPPACTVLRDVGATPGKLLERHLAELQRLGVKRAVTAGSTDALRASAERLHAVVRDFHLARGVFAPMTAEHRRDLASFPRPDDPAFAPADATAAATPRHASATSTRDRSWVLLIIFPLVLFLGITLEVNDFRVSQPVSEALARDPRNTRFTLRAHYGHFVQPGSLVLDLTGVRSATPTDLLRGAVAAADALYDRDRVFERVIFARNGTPVFIMKGADFQTIGADMRRHANPADVMRTFPQKLYTPSGKRAYGTSEGPLPGVPDRQMHDVRDAAHAWTDGGGE